MCSLILCIYSITMIMKSTIAHNFSLSTISETITTTVTEIPPLEPMDELETNCALEIKNLDYDVFCKFQPNGHSCFENNIAVPEFYYDVKMKACRTFHFGGCRESKNVFHSLQECQEACRESGEAVIKHNFTSAVFCRLQPDPGDCGDYIPMYYFELSTHKCVGFAFTGCGGNQNRFNSARDCARTCDPAVAYHHSLPYDRKKI